MPFGTLASSLDGFVTRAQKNYRTLRANTCMTRFNAFTAALAAARQGTLDPDVINAEAHGRIRCGGC